MCIRVLLLIAELYVITVEALTGQQRRKYILAHRDYYHWYLVSVRGTTWNFAVSREISPELSGGYFKNNDKIMIRSLVSGNIGFHFLSQAYLRGLMWNIVLCSVSSSELKFVYRFALLANPTLVGLSCFVLLLHLVSACLLSVMSQDGLSPIPSHTFCFLPTSQVKAETRVMENLTSSSRSQLCD